MRDVFVLYIYINMEAAVLYVIFLCIVQSILNTHVCTALELDRELPTGVMGRLLASPELMFEPRLDENNLIIFNKARPDTYMPYSDRLTTFLEDYYAYPDMSTGNMVDCQAWQGMRDSSEWDTVCRFDPRSYDFAHCVKQHNYGFEDGDPCVFLYLDRTYNWIPEAYDNVTKPEAIENNWTPYELTVTCEGIDPVSKDNLEVDFPGLKGFPLKYFPDLGLPGYQIPVVPVCIIPTPATAVDVTCKLWAKNAEQSELLNTGMVRFTILLQ